MTEAEIHAAVVGELKPLEGPILLADYDPRWPALFEREAARIRSALGDKARLVEHVGSTSVPGLAAKPIIDIVLAVPDSADEASYLPALEATGYVLRIREPDWFEHRVFKGPDTNVNLHVFTVGAGEIERMLKFRDWLRANPADRDVYLQAKRQLVNRDWKYVQNYADAKTTVIEAIIDRARASTPRDSPDARQCDCPADAGIAAFFDRRSDGRRNAGDRYAMANVSKALLAALLGIGPSGRSVLELGCGPGAMLTELLLAGADSGTGVDLSEKTLAEAKDRLDEAGVAGRATLAVGDGAHLPLDTHDWVVLDKVICCYPDADALLTNSIGAARRLYAFAVPSSYGWRGVVARIGFALENVTLSVLGRPCPGYVHDVRLIDERLSGAGFRPSYRGTSHTWHIAVYERAA